MSNKGNGNLKTQAVATNTVTVTPDAQGELTFARCAYVCTATVGNRLINLQLLDVSNNIIGTWQAGVALTAGLTTELAFLPSGAAREAAINNASLNIAIPPNLTVPQGAKIKCFDKSNIDVADTMTFAYLISY